MNTNYLLFLFCFWFLPMQSQYTSVPDPIFEQELINQGIDTNQLIDHQVLTSAVNTLTSLDIYIDYIQDFTGLEAFISLENLTIFSSNNAPTLNLDNNVLLRNIKLFNFASILSLDLTNNVLLETIEIYSQSLTNLNINTCINLKALSATAPLVNLALNNNLNLEELRLSGLNMSSLNISNNLALKKLLLGAIQFTSLDFSNNINLEEITLRNLGGPFTIFDPLLLVNNINLKKLIVQLVSFYPTINLQNNLQLELCVLWYAGLFNLDISNNISLKTLRIDNNFLNSINIQNLNQLQIFGCSFNNINSLNFDNNLFLEALYCDHNNLQNLSVQNGTNSLLNGLIYLNTQSNDRFIATNNPNLKCIYVDDISNCNTNWLSKDPTSYYVTTLQECNNLQNEEFVVNSFKIYPNPVHNSLFVENRNNNAIQKIEVYDLMGKIIIDQNGNSSEINFLNVPSGLYFVKIATEKQTFIKKILKN